MLARCNHNFFVKRLGLHLISTIPAASLKLLITQLTLRNVVSIKIFEMFFIPNSTFQQLAVKPAASLKEAASLYKKHMMNDQVWWSVV